VGLPKKKGENGDIGRKETEINSGDRRKPSNKREG